MTFIQELTKLINKYSIENESDTPDYLLANYIRATLCDVAELLNKRDEWFNDKHWVQPDLAQYTIKDKQCR